MPYITQERRDMMMSLLQLDTPPQGEYDLTITAGDLNFLITTICLATGPSSYADYNELIGMLECCKLELYRRAVAPYEDKKIKENGDVY
mgnify:CR=1 FL=1